MHETGFVGRLVSYWCFEPSQPYMVISGSVSWCSEPSQPHRVISELVIWCSEPSQPHRVISELVIGALSPVIHIGLYHG